MIQTEDFSPNKCPMPVANKLAKRARPKPCGKPPASWLTYVPLPTKDTEDVHLVPAPLCTGCACDVIVSKFMAKFRKDDFENARYKVREDPDALPENDQEQAEHAKIMAMRFRLVSRNMDKVVLAQVDGDEEPHTVTREDFADMFERVYE